MSKLKAEKFYADEASWLAKGITSTGKIYIYQTFGKGSYVERIILEIKQLTRKFRRPFQSVKSFLNIKGFEVFFRFHQSLNTIPATSIKI